MSKLVEVMKVEIGGNEVAVTLFRDREEIMVSFNPQFTELKTFNKWDNARFHNREEVVLQLAYDGIIIRNDQNIS